jgi:hypothetical protein
MPRGKSPPKPIFVFVGKENKWLEQGDKIMNKLFAELQTTNGESISWNIGRVLFVLDGKIVLTSDSIPLQYLIGSKGGAGYTRAAMEFMSHSKKYGHRMRHHEVCLHTQVQFAGRWEDQKNGLFGDRKPDQPQTRAPTCAGAFEAFGALAKNVTTPGGGGFHAVAYAVEDQVRMAMLLVPQEAGIIQMIRHVLDIRQSLVAAGEMTNSVQMLLTKFNQFVLIFAPVLL